MEWVALSCAQAQPTAKGLPRFYAVAALTAHAPAASLHLVLDADASFAAAAWTRPAPPAGAGGGAGGGAVAAGAPVEAGLVPGAAVHLSGWLEDNS